MSYRSILSSPINATTSQIFLQALPPGDSGYLVISKGTPKEEIVYFNAKGPNFIQCATSPSAPTNPDGFGRGLEGTMCQEHDREPIEEFDPQASKEVTIKINGLSITISPTVSLKQPAKPSIGNIN